ncbi:putative coat protein [Rosellinia necatrix megabirnavirus 2-W8]|uniref:Putative coat protein n=1 Tax=Rosellinia necatrix megabirnavirus 2-W8 TaxID=1676267 RepID=A0A0U5BZK0_9VIRU|nr:putative coat protein [Rosellinia necatrix megabirnavirus 2-W8]BAU24261.1 putative coat protein [Rosellinia necatrix megabirnavirus 2-W8]
MVLNSYNTATVPKVVVNRHAFYQNTKAKDYSFRFAREDDAVNTLVAQLETGVVQHQVGDMNYNAGGLGSFSTILSGKKKVTHQQIGAFIDQTGHGAEGSIHSTSTVKQYGTGKEVAGAITDVRNMLGGVYDRKHPGVHKLGTLAATYTDDAPDGLTPIFERLVRGAMHTTAYNAHRQPAPVAGVAPADPMGYTPKQYYHDSRRIMPHRQVALVPQAANVMPHASLINNSAENILANMDVNVTNELTRTLLTISEVPSFRAAELRDIVAVLDACTKANLGFDVHADQMNEHSTYTHGVSRVHDFLILDMCNFYSRCFTDEAAANDNGFENLNDPAPNLIPLPANNGLQPGVALWFGFAGNAANRTGVCNPRSWMNAIAFLLELEGGREACAIAFNNVVEQTTRFFGPNVTMLASPPVVRADPDTFGSAHRVLRQRLGWMYCNIIRTPNSAGDAWLDKQHNQWPTHPKLGRYDDRAAAAGAGAANAATIDQTLARNLRNELFNNAAAAAPGALENARFDFVWADVAHNGPGQAMLENMSGGVDPLNDQLVRRWGDYVPIFGTGVAAANPGEQNTAPPLGPLTITEVDNFWWRFFLNVSLESDEVVEDFLRLMPSSLLSELLIWLTDSELRGGDAFNVRWEVPAALQVVDGRRMTLPIPGNKQHYANPAHMRNFAWVNREEVHYASEFVGNICVPAYTGLAAFWGYVKDTRTGRVTEDDERLAARFRVMTSDKLMSLAFALGGQMRCAADAMAMELSLCRSTIARMQGHILTDNAALDAELVDTDVINAQQSMKGYRNTCLAEYDSLAVGMGIYTMMGTYSRYVECDVRFNGETWNLRRNRQTAFAAYRCLHPLMFEYFCPGANMGGGMLAGQTQVERVESGCVKTFPALFKPEDDSIIDLEIYAAAQQYAIIAGYHIDYTMRSLVKRTGDGTGAQFYELFNPYLRHQIRTSDCGPGSPLLAVSPLSFYVSTFNVDLFEQEGSFKVAKLDLAQQTFIHRTMGWFATTCGDAGRPNAFPHGTQRLANSDIGVNRRFGAAWGAHGTMKPTWGMATQRRRNRDDRFDLVATRVFEIQDATGQVRREYSVYTNQGFALVHAPHGWDTWVQSNRGLIFTQSYGAAQHQQVDRSASGFKFCRNRLTFRMAAMSDDYEFTMHPLAKAELMPVEKMEMTAVVTVGEGETQSRVSTSRMGSALSDMGGKRGDGGLRPRGPRTNVTPVEKPIPGTVEHLEVPLTAGTPASQAATLVPEQGDRVSDPLVPKN